MRLLLTITFGLFTSALFALNPVVEGKFGMDSVECVKNISVYREFVKQKNYTDAVAPWRWAYINCPRSTKNLYIDGSDNVELQAGGSTKAYTYANGLFVYNQQIPDSGVLNLGNGSDLKLWHNGTNSYLKSETGTFYIMSSDLRLVSTDGAENYFRGYSNGAVELYYDHVLAFKTGSNGNYFYKHCDPYVADSFNLGHNYRWKTLYTNNAVDVSSDRNTKNTIIRLITVAIAAPATPNPKPKPPYASNLNMKIGSRIIFSIVPKPAIIIGNFISPSPAKIERKKPEKIMKGIPKHITRRYSQPRERISPSAPKKAKIVLPDTSPIADRKKLMIAAINTACSALLSACFLLSWPINLAIEAVTPVPSPIVRPKTKKNKGILKAIPVIACPPSFPMKIISTKLYRV